jgi:hypothetical protein
LKGEKRTEEGRKNDGRREKERREKGAGSTGKGSLPLAQREQRADGEWEYSEKCVIDLISELPWAGPIKGLQKGSSAKISML